MSLQKFHRLIKTTVITTLTLVAILLAAHFIVRYSQNLSDEQFKMDVERDLPIGSTIPQVNHFLDKHHVTYTYDVATPFDPHNQIHGFRAEKFALFPPQSDLEVSFYIDNHMLLRGYKIRRVDSGL